MYNNRDTPCTLSAAKRREQIEAQQKRDARANRWAMLAIYAMLVLLAAAIIYRRVQEWRGQL